MMTNERRIAARMPRSSPAVHAWGEPRLTRLGSRTQSLAVSNARTHTLASVLLMLMAGCRPGLGEADADAAHEVVYDRDGVPAYAGQALVIQSCGAGGFCHSDGIEPAERFGAPAGLGFDLRIASLTVELEQESVLRLRNHVNQVIAHAPSIWEQVSALRMPPRGEAGRMYREATGITFERFDEAGRSIGPLPELDTEEGREILRNWLAMGELLPIVERTQPRLSTTDPLERAGDVVPLCERDCVDPSFESIFRQILVPSCARSRCHHGGDEPASQLSLFADVFEEGLSRQDEIDRMNAIITAMTNTPAEGSQCRAARAILLVPGEPLRSLLYMKVAAATSQDVCGSKMPLAGNPLSDQRLCALREWIACGACGVGDAACDACIAAARETCGVAAPFDPASGVAECVEVTPCMNRPPPQLEP